MCRHLAYLGPPATLRSVIIDPPYGLYRQAWAPRMQRPGAINADGFGVGWYAASDATSSRSRGTHTAAGRIRKIPAPSAYAARARWSVRKMPRIGGGGSMGKS